MNHLIKRFVNDIKNQYKNKVFSLNKDLTNYYLEKSKNKIKATELLFENGFYNDCISRCYYSMFWAAS